jgi:hypothetical protein
MAKRQGSNFGVGDYAIVIQHFFSFSPAWSDRADDWSGFYPAVGVAQF